MRQEELTRALIHQLSCVTDEIRHANLLQHHRITSDETDHAMADPALAAVMSTLPELSDNKRRQVLYVNRRYATVVLGYRIGSYGWDELIGHLRVLGRNPVFAEYWQATGEHRRSLPNQSLEVRVGQAVDVIMDELAEDPDEWWVVGPSPEPDS
ncbi:DUF6082 family protein [Streptomyces sp. NBC_01518]|uniref:DUF6082 family protein n=1 Tax=Streptomyces sp. NBC_01518 TaxID=2903891 RepID=UPI003869F9FF